MVFVRGEVGEQGADLFGLPFEGRLGPGFRAAKVQQRAGPGFFRAIMGRRSLARGKNLRRRRDGAFSQ